MEFQNLSLIPRYSHWKNILAQRIKPWLLLSEKGSLIYPQ